MKDKIAVVIYAVLLTIVVYALSIAIYGLLIWGAGALIINVFGLNYELTYMQCVCVGVVLVILRDVFSVRVKVDKKQRYL